jgi:uncharacterized protein (TIGR03435 family)
MQGRIGRQAWRGAGVGFACLALLVASGSSLSGQETSAASGSAQLVQRDFRFEVASIRPAEPPNGHEYLAGAQGYTPGRFRETNRSFVGLAFQAFAVKRDFEMEYPRWMESAYFTVNATLPEGATKADVPIMMRHLLEDRFGLVFHHEMRRMNGYELVVAKSSPHLAKSSGTPDASAVKGPGFEVKNGVPQFAKDAPSGQLFINGTVIWHARARTMEQLAGDLANQLRAPVLDATGLDGKYDYMFTYANEGNSAGEDPMRAVMLDAMQEQLGLKVRPIKNVPVDIVVVDSAKREPTEN